MPRLESWRVRRLPSPGYRSSKVSLKYQEKEIDTMTLVLSGRNRQRLEKRRTTERVREGWWWKRTTKETDNSRAFQFGPEPRDRAGRSYKGRASPECPDPLLPFRSLSALSPAARCYLTLSCISNSLLIMLRKQIASTRLSGSLAPRRFTSRNALASLPPRAPLSRISPCPRLTTGSLVLSRSYAQGPPGGGAGGFPGFNMMGQQRQKGEALKEYVSFLHIRLVTLPILSPCWRPLLFQTGCRRGAKSMSPEY